MSLNASPVARGPCLRRLLLGAVIVLKFFVLARSAHAQQTISAGRVVRMQRDTTAWAQPSAKSKVVADLDMGTLLVLVEKSARGLWVKLKDEDGNEGWVPTKYTDLAPELPKKKVDSTPQPGSSTIAKLDEKLMEDASKDTPPPKTFEPSARHLVFEGGIRKAFSDPNGDWAWTLKSSYFFLGTAERAYGLMSGYYRYAGGMRGGFAIPVRVRARLYSRASGVAIGPDAGVLFMKYPAGSSKNWAESVSLGISSQRIYEMGLLYGLRAGIEFVHGFRFGLELDVGWDL